jgi:hypothetical protein
VSYCNAKMIFSWTSVCYLRVMELEKQVFFMYEVTLFCLWLCLIRVSNNFLEGPAATLLWVGE